MKFAVYVQAGSGKDSHDAGPSPLGSTLHPVLSSSVQSLILADIRQVRVSCIVQLGSIKGCS